MKPKVLLKRIYHRDKQRIAICFDFDARLKEKVNTIPGVSFSQTHKCFYTDYSEDNLKLILLTFKDIADIDISAISWKESKSPFNGITDESFGSVSKSESPPELEYDEEKFIQPRTIRIVKDTKNDSDLKQPFTNQKKERSVEFRVNEKENLLVIRFQCFYDQEWIRELRSYGHLEYDRKRKEWLLPWSKLTTDSLADYFSRKGVSVRVTRHVVDEDLKLERKSTGDEIRTKQLGSQALEGLEMLGWFLDENRYSPRTRESYLAMLEFFFRYFSPREPMEISEDEISSFLYSFIIKLGYSAAYQNQMVSAIKIYYNIAGKGRISPGFLERPRRSRALPKVFSKDEVTRILNSGGNLKHKMLLWLIYSCGLRRSEVTNLKLSDFDRERGLLHIREGKGRVDRYVPVPGRVWDKLDEYLAGYKPRTYLFEGQTGGKYSSESVYKVFKDALLRTGIKKEVGVHSLRHSYATHLHENGLDIRYIQELLGHKSTRTTEIYTHVSRRNLVAVRSPIEDLDLK